MAVSLCDMVSKEIVAESQLDEEPAGFAVLFGPDLYLQAFPTLAGGEVIAWTVRVHGEPIWRRMGGGEYRCLRRW